MRDADPRGSRWAALALAAVGAVVAVAAGAACSSAPRPPASHDAASSLQLDLAALRRRGFSEPLIHQRARSRFRYFRMLGEPFERRTCDAFREVLPSLPITVVQGDAHLEQFVVTGASYGLEDFDRAGFGPAVVDLVRYAASLHVACADLPWRCDADAAVERFLSASLFDEELLGLAAECIRQHTQRDVLATLRFREAFLASSQGQPVLHLVLHARCSSAEGFEWWSDWDDEWAWLSADEAMQRCGFEEDRRAIALALTPSPR